jgi:hypothetical protein
MTYRLGQLLKETHITSCVIDKYASKISAHLDVQSCAASSEHSVKLSIIPPEMNIIKTPD